MKKICSILFCITIILALNAGCSKNSAQNQLKDGVKLLDIVNAVNTDIGISMPVNVSDTTLTQVFHIQKSDAIDYAGLYSISSASADTMLIVKASDGKAQAIKQDLSNYKQEVMDSFEKYLPDEYKKAKSARIIEKNDYIIYLCVGVSEKNSYDKSLDNAEEIINSFFD